MFFSTSCKICKIIRIFLLSVFLLVLLALIQKDKLHYLKFITPENAAYVILISGILITIYKIFKNIWHNSITDWMEEISDINYTDFATHRN